MQLPYPVRVLGLDLGITSAHRGVVVDGEGQVRARRSAVPTVDSLSVLEAAALQGAEPGTRLLVVVEPTGPAWLPIARFFGRRGHLVVRCPRPRPRTCAGSCPGTPRPTASTPRRWPGCRWWPPTGRAGGAARRGPGHPGPARARSSPAHRAHRASTRPASGRWQRR